jgi:hypothetical protein
MGLERPTTSKIDRLHFGVLADRLRIALRD